MSEISQLVELIKMMPTITKQGSSITTLNGMVGKKVIIRTYSAGVWFGELVEKAGSEVIINNARRLWRWWTKESISLSSIALYGINQNKSKVAPANLSVWLEAIEIIPCSEQAINSIESAPNASAE